MLNRIALMGRLTRDPELKYTPSNVPVCTITLACERNIAGSDGRRETDFIDVVAWRNTAEFVSKYFRKGVLIAVEGRLQSRKWQDKYQQNRVTFEVVADSVYFAERTDRPAENNQQSSYGAPPPQYAPAPQYGAPQYSSPQNQNYQRQAAPPPQQQSFGNLDIYPGQDIDDDDVPF